MTDWTNFTVLGIPPANTTLEIDVEYEHDVVVPRVAVGYFDPSLNEFRELNHCGALRGKVSRWREIDEEANDGRE